MADNSIPPPPPGFKVVGSSDVPPPPPGFKMVDSAKGNGFLSNAVDAVGDFVSGAENAGMQSMLQLGGHLPGKLGEVARQEQKDPKLRFGVKTPGGKAESAGKFVMEDVLPWAAPLPGSKLLKTRTGAKIGERILTGAAREGLESGVRTTAATGDPKAGLEGAGIGAALGASGGALKNLKVGPLVKNTLNPVERKALDSVKHEIRATAGQRTGNMALKRVEQGLENLPGSSSRAQTYFGEQQEEIADAAARRAERASPVKTDAVGAGQGIKDRLQNRFMKLKNHADRMYDDVRSATAANKQTIQTGTKASLALGPNGKPIQTPIYTVFETPVALDPIRAPLKTVYEDLKTNMPEVRRQNSPAFAALKNLMESDKTHMDAMDFDKFLGAVKALSREGQSEYLTTTSQRLAKQVIDSGEREMGRALLRAGPDVPNKLRIGRKAVKSYYETGELMADLHDEPASLYKKLTAGGDTSHNLLNTIHQYAPHQLETVGRTYIEGMIDKATKEGGFGRAPGVLQDWNNLGPRAKQLMFGPKLTEDISNLLIAAKKLTRPLNASGSGHQMAAFGAMGIIGTAGMNAGWSLITGQFTKAAAEAGVGVAGIAVPNVMARVLFSPGGARALTKVVTLPSRVPAWSVARAALMTAIVKANQEESQGSPENSQQQ